MIRNFIFFALFSTAVLNAQTTTLFSENFEPGSPTMSQWSLGDLDGDGFNWHIVMGSSYTDAAGFAPGEMAASTGYNTDPNFPPSRPLTPNNIAATPAVEIPILQPNETVTLKYKVGPYLNQMANMSYSMCILPASQTFDVATAAPVRTKAFTAMGALNETVDISSFAGQSIKVYFRHHNGDGQWYLLLDDVLIQKGPKLATTESVKEKLSLYPNPADQVLNFNGITNIDSYEIFDASGKIIQSQNDKKSSVDVSKLQTGKYIIKLKSGDNVYTETFLKK